TATGRAGSTSRPPTASTCGASETAERHMRPSKHSAAAALALSLVLVPAGVASASVVERVVAVVGEQALLLSELRERAKPFLLQLGQQAEDEAHRAAATSQLYARLLQRMVEDEL